MGRFLAAYDEYRLVKGERAGCRREVTSLLLDAAASDIILVEFHMINPSLATIFTVGAAVFVAGLIAYRLMWAGAQFSGFGVLPRSLRRWQRWIQGEAATRK